MEETNQGSNGANQQNASSEPATAPTLESEIATLKERSDAHEARVAALEAKLAALPDLTGIHEKLASYGIR